MNRTPLKVSIKYRITYVHMAVGRCCYFCFIVYIILVFSSVVLLWSVFVLLFSPQSREVPKPGEGCVLCPQRMSLELVKRHW